MKLSELFATAPAGGIHLVETDESALCDLGWAIAAAPPKPAVRTIRSKKTRTRAALFDEMAATLQFPYYFGENWDALDEVINDLSWFPDAAFLLLFSRAELLLADADDGDFRLLARVLASAHTQWRTENVRFHAAFQCATPDALDAFGLRLESAGVDFDRVVAG